MCWETTDVLAADTQMSGLQTQEMSWLQTQEMSWLQTQQLSWLQTSMWLPKKAASGGFFPGKTTISSKKVCILLFFDTFRLILTPKPSKTIKSLPGEALNKNMASRVDETQNFESRADETNTFEGLGPSWTCQYAESV